MRLRRTRTRVALSLFVLLIAVLCGVLAVTV